MDALRELASALRHLADLVESLDLSEMPQQPPPDPEIRRLLSFSDAATYLGVSVSAMKHQLGGPAGQIPRVELGRRVLFDQVDLDAYVERIK